ncbi:hypothetical protein HDU98_003488 [Podochytrium sp. JEL0797]|nr:hypothetical protein HDU98_003488 [Podochytrium sp. JEL0797]
MVLDRSSGFKCDECGILAVSEGGMAKTLRLTAASGTALAAYDRAASLALAGNYRASADAYKRAYRRHLLVLPVGLHITNNATSPRLMNHLQINEAPTHHRAQAAAFTWGRAYSHQGKREAESAQYRKVLRLGTKITPVEFNTQIVSGINPSTSEAIITNVREFLQDDSTFLNLSKSNLEQMNRTDRQGYDIVGGWSRSDRVG